MIRMKLSSVTRIIAVGFVMLSALAAQAAGQNGAIVKWHAVGIINGRASPFTTAAYFPRPLVSGELVDITFTIDTTAVGVVSGTYANYQGAITAVKVSGNNWSLNLRSPLGEGDAIVTNDDVDYGDSLALIATTPLVPQKTWYSVQLDLRNPGGPNPGPGPWAPFTSLALPKAPPPLGLMPNKTFYLQARRDQPGQQFDGASYYGEILWMSSAPCDDQ